MIIYQLSSKFFKYYPKFINENEPTACPKSKFVSSNGLIVLKVDVQSFEITNFCVLVTLDVFSWQETINTLVQNQCNDQFWFMLDFAQLSKGFLLFCQQICIINYEDDIFRILSPF